MNTTENERLESSCPESRGSGAVSVPATISLTQDASFVGGNMKLSDALRGLGRPVAIYPGLCRVLGGVNATLFLCQMAYWTGKQRDEDGWIYKTQEEIEEETGLSKKEQRTARGRLTELGILEERESRLEHKLYYRINLDCLNELWDSGVNSGSAERALREVPNGNSAKCPTVTPYIEHRLPPETTPEITKKKNEEVSFDKNSAKLLIPEQLISMWHNKFPALQIRQEISKMEAWLDANPANQKTQYKRFIVNWLTRAQDKAPRIEQRTGLKNPYADPQPDPLDNPYPVTCKTCKRHFKMTKRLWSASPFERTGECQECYDLPH